MRFGVSLAALLLSFGSTASGADPSGLDVVRGHVEAVGGKQAIAAIQSFHVTGSYSVPAHKLEGTIDLYFARPGKALFVVELTGFGRVERGFDGEVAWSIDPVRGAEILKGGERDFLLTQISRGFGLLPDANAIASATRSGKTREGGRALIEIEVSWKTGMASTELYDADTGLFAGRREEQPTPQGATELVGTAGEYRRFGSLRVPTVWTHEGGGLEWTAVYETFESGGVDTGVFDLPDAIRKKTAQHRRPETAPSLATLVQEIAKKQRLVGYASAALHRGELVHSEQFGFADLENRVPVGQDSRFFVASVAKTLTAAATLRLVERGRLDLDAPIQRYIPAFPAKPGPPITARLLLAHRAGVRNYRPGELGWDLFGRHYTTATDALSVFAGDALVAVPGERTAYSSFGYNLLAAAIESITGEPYPAHLHAIIESLGLENTLVPDARLPVARRARSYRLSDPATGVEGDVVFRAREADFSYNYGGGNLVSTAEDLVRYGRSFTEPDRLLSRESLEAIYRDPQDPDQSFGWIVRNDGAGRVYIHVTGASEAFQAALTVWPDDDLAVALVTNTWGINSRAGEFTLPLTLRMGRQLLGP